MQFIAEIHFEQLPPDGMPRVWLPSCVPSRATIDVKIGSNTEACLVEGTCDTPNSIRYATAAPFRLLLNKLRLFARISATTVYLGPLVGTFVSKGTINSIVRGEAKPKLWEMARVSASNPGLLYYFTIGDVDFDARIINGCFYHYADDSWYRGLLPFPDVYWDRSAGFLRGQKHLVKSTRAKLHEQNLPPLNPVYHFSKWSVHRKLLGHPRVTEYLPESIRYRGALSLRTMLSKHKEIYLKSFYGSNGRAVMQVKETSQGYYYSAFRGEPTVGCCNTVSQLIEVIRTFFNTDQIVVQQGIRTLTHQGCKVDFRALVQRDQAGEWHLTALPMRIAQANCPITSTASGSSVFPIRYGLVKLLGWDGGTASRAYRSLERAVWQLVSAIEKEYGQFGELGIDLALDPSGRVWFFECNSKPGKDTVMLAGIKSEVELAFGRPMQYAAYLAGFGSDAR